MVVNQAYTQEFFRTEEVSRKKATSRNISATTNKQNPSWGNIWFFHLDTPKTAFLIRHLAIDPLNLGIFPNKQGYSFQFPKKGRGGLSLLHCSLRLLTYFKIFMYPSKKMPLKFPKYMVLILDGG